MTPLYNLTEYSDNHGKTSPILWQCYKYDLNDNISDYDLFKFKASITKQNPIAGNTIGDETVVLLKQLSSFWRTLETPLLNCETNTMLTWF